MHVFLFDIDGTLIQTAGAGRAALESAFQSVYGIEGATKGVELSGRTDRAIVRDMLLAHAIEITPEIWANFRDAYLGHLPGHLASRQGRVLPGIAECLQRLARVEGVEVGLLTGNIRRGAEIKLGHYGLASSFSFGGFGDEHIDRCDVAAEAMAAARGRLGSKLSAERVWVIGDTPHDVSCARAVGAKAVAVATGTHSRGELEASRPDVLLDDLTDLSPWCGLWG